MRGKYTNVVMKFQLSLGRDKVLMYNKDRSIMGELPMDKAFELIFGKKKKVYCKCKYRNSDGYLEIGEEVKANW